MRNASKLFALMLLLSQGVSAWAVQVESPRGGKPLNFIFDSGAEASVVNLQTARLLRLEPGQPVTVCGMNATTVGYWPGYLPVRLGRLVPPTKYIALDFSALC
jgi:hypothetical protein